MNQAPEYSEVEKPLIDQLVGMGWVHTPGNFADPAKTFRESFREVVLVEDLSAALRRINLDPMGKPWLDEVRIAQAVNALKRQAAANLVEANQETTKLLLKGTVVDGVEGWNEGRGQTIQFVDWDDPENNTFRVVNQFRVACPIGQATKHIDPDVVLFVNGIPLVVVECKSPYAPSALEEAVDQLQRYANRRKELGIVDVNEGNEELFRYGQVLVATCFEQARAATFSALACHYLEWKDTSPVPMAEVAAKLGKEDLSSQEKLVAGMLRPAHLLDIVRHFTLFTEVGGRTVKVVCRYQQFRAVQLAYRRLLDGKTRSQDGEHDRRGGIIWHTQGSGKSLTMVFLIRKMRSDERLRGFKVICVTDRKDLEKQLVDTAELTDEPLTRVRTKKKGQRTVSALEVLKETLALPGKDLVFAMIQKYRGERLDHDEDDDEVPDDADALIEPAKTEPLPVLNTDEAILVLVDEAHRSHGSTLHANLLNALPNCARMGFTGTPIIMGAKKRTHEIFGDFIDRYTILQSENDGATVKVLYEGRTTKAGVEGGGDLDAKFDDMFAAEHSPEELDRIRKQYGTKGHVMEATALIDAKARDILRHYVANIMPNGFKAQVVAVSRRATIRYYDAFLKARDALVAELEALDPGKLILSHEQVDDLPANEAFLIRAHRFLGTIRKLDFAPVISGRHNDSVDPKGEWSDRAKIETRITRFKKPLFHRDPQKADHLAFLIVKSMLLTGFDAPVEQVMYLDRPIKEAELLQAIARVNRTYAQGSVEKPFGIVVDYYGVARHLKEALAAYSEEDVDGALVSCRDEIPKLRDLHLRLVRFLREHDIESVGGLSARERKQLAAMFCRWRHPEVRDPARAALLGDGNMAAGLRVLDALDRFLLVPTPGVDGKKDPYARIHEKVVGALKTLLNATPSDRAAIMDATDKLNLAIEPVVYKLLSLCEPARFQALRGKKKGLTTGMFTLMDCGRSRYTLKLSEQEFVRDEGWEVRSSYENAIRDVVPARNEAGHESPEVPLTLWQSAVAVLLGLVDANLADLERLPAPEEPEREGIERSVTLLRDEKLRAEFHVQLKQFLETLDGVLPRPEALPYVHDAKVFSYVQAKARNRYRGDELLIGKEVGAKVRKLIDDHILSRGIDPKIPPISITDADFDEYVEGERSPEARASEMEHALRHHIRKHFDEDPVRYEKLSERLEGILEDLEGNWDGVVVALAHLVREAREGRRAEPTGLDPETQAPFFDVLRREVPGLTDVQAKRLSEVTVEVVEHIRQELGIVDFWAKVEARQGLAKWIVQVLDASDLFPDLDQLPRIADRVMELAKANHAKLAAPAELTAAIPVATGR